jgi:hypothetical protein
MVFLKRHRQLFIYAGLLIAAVLCFIHAPQALPIVGMAMLVDKSNTPPLSGGDVWVNKPGAFDDFVRTNVMDFDGMPTEDYLKYYGAGKRIKFGQDHQRWYARVWAPATTIAANAAGLDFYQKTSGDTEKSLDGGTDVVIDDYYTNMADAGRMEKGSTLIVHAIGIQCNIPHREFAAFTALQPVSAAVTSTDTSSATAHQLIIDRSAIFEFTRGSGVGAQHLVQGSLFDFPSKGGPGGIASGNTVEGLASNGYGWLNYLREVIVLDEGRQFKFSMKTYRAMLSVLNVEIRPILYGTLLRSV